MPSALAAAAAGIAAMAGVFQTYSTLLGREAGVAMLVLLVAFKMLEMQARRDLFVVVFLVLLSGADQLLLFAEHRRGAC